MSQASDPLGGALPETIEGLVRQHHLVYPRLPPQGVYFEHLAERAFVLTGAVDAHIARTAPNQPEHDLVVGNNRVSLKTETGQGTKPASINITKLCTTERDPWAIESLIQHVLGHLWRYNLMLMLRALWPTANGHIHYQLVEIPVPLLRNIASIEFAPVGHRAGRRSLGGDHVNPDGQVVYHVHFDGADGKCQMRNLRIDACRMLREWDQRY